MIYLRIFFSFCKIGALTFGGGYAMLPMMEREIVQSRKWMSNEDVIDIFAVSQGLPGAIALNSATLIGYRVRGVFGGISATLGAVTPSLIIISLIAAVLGMVWGNEILQSAFAGIGAAVCALILNTVIKFFKSGVIDIVCGVIFAAVLACSLLLPISPFLYILMAIVIGIAVAPAKKAAEKTAGDKKPAQAAEQKDGEEEGGE